MRRILLFLTAIALWMVGRCAPVMGAAGVHPDTVVAIIGRWDVTVHYPGREVPSWLEIQASGVRTLVGRWVGGGGSARPISKVKYDGMRFSFSIPPQWEREDRDMSVEGRLEGDSLVGTMVAPDGKQYNWVGRRSPALRRMKEPVWGPTEKLFDGVSLKGWHAMGSVNQWVAQDGILRSPHSGSNIATDEKFGDFKLHIEFRYPPHSNSGVYLRGRYELQIEDEGGTEPPNNEIGAIYGFISPNEKAGKPAGEWQSYDVTLVGRTVTVVFNGKTVICRQEIPGITGGALDSREGEPGPIYLQGDHGPIEFRNVTIARAR
jgi:hypothetical protein